MIIRAQAKHLSLCSTVLDAGTVIIRLVHIVPLTLATRTVHVVSLLTCGVCFGIAVIMTLGAHYSD